MKEAAYQQEIQVTRTQLYVKDQEIQATKSELQRTAFELQWRDLEVRTELEQQFVGQIQQQKGVSVCLLVDLFSVFFLSCI